MNVYVELFDADAPVTVANFLHYVDDGAGDHRYDGTFIHRSIPGFVLQGGGYKYDSTLGDFGPASVSHIAEDAPIVNEFNPAHSNVAGTLTMAKVSGDPNSATSEWFFNAADNSANLDNTNGGYTVFGQVLGLDFQNLASILSLGTINLGNPFTDLPLANGYVSPNPITDSDLVHLNTIEIDPPAHLSVRPRTVDFDLVDPLAAPPTRNMTLQNAGGQDLTFGQIGAPDPLDAPFSFTADTCSNVTLGPTESCSLSLTFASATSGAFADTFDIPSNDLSQPLVSYAVTGIAQAGTPTLYIDSGPDLDFGEIGVGDQTTAQVIVRNIGTGALSPSAGAITGTDAARFTVVDDACATTTLDVGQTCAITLQMDGASLGTTTAQLQVNAAPGSQSTQVNLTGLVRASQAALTLPATLPYPIGDVRFALSTTASIPLVNSGTDTLVISSITVTGADAGDFSVAGVCQRIVSGGVCQEQVTFSPASTGVKTASLQIDSNDPNTPAMLPISGTSSSDNDGVSDAIENAGPNGGDANHDGTPDDLQENVATLPDLYGDYVTLEAPLGSSLTGVAAIDNPAPGAPLYASGGALSFPTGFYRFNLENVAPGSTADVTLHLPAGTRVNAYFKYGHFLTSPASFWYLFNFTNGTGAELLSDRVVLHLRDGGRGDDDATADGRIVDPGGPGLVVSTDSGSSGGCTMIAGNGGAPQRHRLDGWLALGVVLLLRRRRSRVN